MGTRRGLSRLDLESETTTNFTVDETSPTDGVLCILGNDSGYLWMSTFRGISKFNLETEGIYQFRIRKRHRGSRVSEWIQLLQESSWGNVFSVETISFMLSRRIKSETIRIRPL